MKEKIIQFAKEQGFDLIGFSSVKVDGFHIKAFNNWLKKRYEGNMEYMKKTAPRKNVQKILPKAQTVISLAINYYHEQKPLKKGFGRIARYAPGRDYHKIIKKKLIIFEKFIKTISPDSESKLYIDTGPILERSFAENAGLGFVGKNTCLITKNYGSFVFLAEIISTLKLERDKKILKTSKPFAGCGGCRKCIDACPTKAIIAPGIIDARRCISYLTIENKKQIPKKFHAAIKNTGRIFGCDICQEVCPYNKKAKPTLREEFSIPCIAGDQISLKKILSIRSDAEFLKLFAGSPLMRAKRKGLQRNAKTLN